MCYISVVKIFCFSDVRKATAPYHMQMITVHILWHALLPFVQQLAHDMWQAVYNLRK